MIMWLLVNLFVFDIFKSIIGKCKILINLEIFLEFLVCICLYVMLCMWYFDLI